MALRVKQPSDTPLVLTLTGLRISWSKNAGAERGEASGRGNGQGLRKSRNCRNECARYGRRLAGQCKDRVWLELLQLRHGNEAYFWKKNGRALMVSPSPGRSWNSATMERAAVGKAGAVKTG